MSSKLLSQTAPYLLVHAAGELQTANRIIKYASGNSDGVKLSVKEEEFNKHTNKTPLPHRTQLKQLLFPAHLRPLPPIRTIIVLTTNAATAAVARA
jgi:hypothetical protein